MIDRSCETCLTISDLDYVGEEVFQMICTHISHWF